MGTVHPEENSYVMDQESGAEMARLVEFDRMITKCMGSLFPTEIDLSGVHDILDVASGSGGWVSEVAFAHPDKQVVGIDISRSMLDYARAYTRVEGLQNATYRYMDATSLLEFPDASFDFVNARFITGFMWKEAWPQFVRECARITRLGGILHFTESDFLGAFSVGDSVPLSQVNRLVTRAFCRTGRSFCPDEDGFQIGVTPLLSRFLDESGYQVIRERAHVLNYSAGADAYSRMANNLQIGIKLAQPFLVKSGVATADELDQMYQRVLVDLLREDFRAFWFFVSIYGQKRNQ